MKKTQKFLARFARLLTVYDFIILHVADISVIVSIVINKDIIISWYILMNQMNKDKDKICYLPTNYLDELYVFLMQKVQHFR